MALHTRSLRRIAGLLKARLPDIALGAAADPRSARGRRWPLTALLKLPLVAIMAGCHSLRQAEALSDEMALPMRGLLGIARRVPDTTLRHTLVALTPDTLRDGLRRQIRAAHRRKALVPQGLPFGVVAIDGKATAIGTWDDTYAQRQRHSNGRGACGIVRTLTATLVSSPAAPCLDAQPIAPQTNEMGTFTQALHALVAAYGSLDLFKVISADSGMCSLHNAQAVIDADLHYLFGLKADQPTLLTEAKRLLGHRHDTEAETVDVVGTTTVTRRLFITTQMAGLLDWTHLKTVVRVQSETRDINTDQILAQQDRYFLCSLPHDALSGAQWLHLVRAHWGVENATHCTWDKAFREDDHPWITAGHGAPRGALVVMLLRRIAYNLMALYRCVTQRSDERRQMPWKDLMRWIYNTLIAARPVDIAALRLRTASTASVA